MVFVPRQVALAASSSSSSQPRAAAASAPAPAPAMAKAKEEPRKEKKGKSKAAAKGAEDSDATPGARAAVVASVAAFLESAGLPRTLAALQSEAGLEAGAWGSSQVNLEELVARFLESSNSTPAAAAAVGSSEQEKGNYDIAEKDAKKKKKKSGVEASEPESKASEPSAHEKLGENGGGEAKEIKSKKKKKDKGDISVLNAGGGEATETVKDDDQKLDGKKKKTKKQGKDDDVKARLEKAELAILNKFEAAKEVNGDISKSREEEPKSKNAAADNSSVAVEKKKKNKKEKSAVETSEKTDAGTGPDEADGAIGKNGAVGTAKDGTEKKAKKKRRKSDPEENVQVEGKEAAGSDDANKSGMDVEEGNHGKSSNENAAAGKKRKLEEVEGTILPATVKEDSTANPSLSNGFAEDETKEESNLKPNKRQKRSSEPKTVIPFQRVKVEDVKFADERLQDNSYWAKGGADTGYGAKAQEVLGQVRGRGFRHEKTKKKRGTYRGGQIDLQTHSIKFENSDDE